MKRTWEYTVEDWLSDEEMTELGESGWELVTVWTHDDGRVISTNMAFKRETTEP